MYKSPIELLITEVTNQIVKEDEAIFKSVLNYVPNVDREELLRALQYDRNQYEKGYADGKADAMSDIVHCEECDYTCPGSNGLVCTMWGAGTDPGGWCYKAERKDNESNL